MPDVTAADPLARIQARLRDLGAPWPAPLFHFPSLGSTNDWLKERARREGTALLPEWTTRLGISVPVVNELHGKVAFADHHGAIPRDAPLLIWNDPVDLGALGQFPAGVHLRPRGVQTVLGIWSYDTPRIEHAVFPPAFPPHYADIVIGGLAAGAIIGGAIAGPRYYAPPPAYVVEPEPVYAAPRCFWTRGEPVWDRYNGMWVRPRVRVCD